MEAGTRRAIRWGDLVSPREMYFFALEDAWGSLPTLFAMAGMFIGCVLVIYLVKKFFEWLLLPKERFKKYVLENTKQPDAQGRVLKIWRRMPTTHYGSIIHLILETFLSFGVLISALFAGAIGGINVWQSAIASVGIGIIGTYILGPCLQILGSGFFFFITNSMSVNEYWCLLGGGSSVEGRVSRITPFYVEMMALDENGHGCLNRVSMLTVMSSNWRRSFHKEAHESIIIMDKVMVAEPATQMGSQLLGDEEEGADFYEDFESEEDEEHKKRR